MIRRVALEDGVYINEEDVIVETLNEQGIMDVRELCEALIVAWDEGDYGAKITFDGILHYLHIAQRNAISLPTLDLYRQYRSLTGELQTMRDQAHINKRRKIEAARS